MRCGEYVLHARYRKDAWNQDDYAQQPANDGEAHRKDADMNDPNSSSIKYALNTNA
ncbi:hypothetical protein ABIC83_002837 [Roseateles asaccharophilus]